MRAVTENRAKNYRSTRIMQGQRIRALIAVSGYLFRHIVLRYDDAISPSGESLPTPPCPPIIILSEAGAPGTRRFCVCWGGGVAVHFHRPSCGRAATESKNLSAPFHWVVITRSEATRDLLLLLPFRVPHTWFLRVGPAGHSKGAFYFFLASSARRAISSATYSSSERSASSIWPR
jgi:hypothetical protein